MKKQKIIVPPFDESLVDKQRHPFLIPGGDIWVLEKDLDYLNDRNHPHREKSFLEQNKQK